MRTNEISQKPAPGQVVYKLETLFGEEGICKLSYYAWNELSSGGRGCYAMNILHITKLNETTMLSQFITLISIYYDRY